MNDLRLDHALESLLQASRLPTPPDQLSETAFATPAIKDFGAAFQNAPPANRHAAVQRIAEALGQCQPMGAARLALLCGTLVETGWDASVVAPAVAQRFRHQLTLISSVIDTFPKYEKPPADPAAYAQGEQLEAIYSHRFLCQALVSHLAASPELRTTLAQDAAFMAALKKAAVLPATGWVREALAKSSGEIIVLAPAEQQGFLVAYRNLSNCFHLFTLLQEALAPHFHIDIEPHASAIAMARGDKDIDSNAFDWAIWTYCDYYGVHSLAALLWGEMPPAAIPQFAGTPVILLLSGGPRRSWDVRCCGPQLSQFPPAVEILQILPREKVLEWCERLKHQAKQ